MEEYWFESEKPVGNGERQASVMLYPHQTCTYPFGIITMVFGGLHGREIKIVTNSRVRGGKLGSIKFGGADGCCKPLEIKTAN